jgi:DNA polymerase-1
MAETPHFCLIDGSGFMHRAKAIAPSRARASDCLDIGVADLFGKMVAKVATRASAGKSPPTHWAVAFDPPRAHSWRRQVCAAYKAHRPETEEAFKLQVPVMQECCRAAGYTVLEAPHHEADDILAAYAHDALAAGSRVTLVTSDKDLMQLVRPGLLMWDAKADVWFSAAAVEAKFGVPPSRVADFLALAGDVADGIPGAKGIGAKTAKAILSTGFSLTEILDRPERLENLKWRALVEANVEALRLARLLVSLDIAGCPRPVALDKMATVYPEGAPARIRAWARSALA